MTGSGYRENRTATVDPDASKYPRHVPTVREQLEGSKADLDPENLTKRELGQYTALGVLANPMTLRAHLEPHYEADSIRERMANWSHENGDGTRTTTAHQRYGEGHDKAVYPSKSRMQG